MKFSSWHQYFLRNRNHFRHIPWNETGSLTAAEIKVLAPSIRQFQRGEYSEGRNFIRFATSMQDGSYSCSVLLFIREEQDHAAVLGRYMALHQITPLQQHWLDGVFRRLRKTAGLEGLITVLLTAEMISMAYYKALGKATRCPVLQAISKQVLKDEVMHLRFQSAALHELYTRKSRWRVNLSAALHRLLVSGTIVTVWCCHHQLLHCGGYRFSTFAKDVWKAYRNCRLMIRGEKSSSPVFKTRQLLSSHIDQ